MVISDHLAGPPGAPRIRHALTAALLGSSLLGVLLAWRECLIPDEYYSLQAIGNLARYPERPLYFVYLNVGAWFGTDPRWLRLWSFVPWICGLLVARRILVRGGFGRSRVDLAIVLMALNPVLVRYGIRIRYYGTNFLVVMAAIWGLQSILRPDLSRLRRASCWALVLLPPLVAPTGLIVSVLMVALWLRATRDEENRGQRRRVLTGLVASCAVALWALAAWTVGAIQARGWRHTVLELPFSPGYGRPPPSWEALPFQYCKLMGWSCWSAVAPPLIVGLAALAVTAAAGWIWLKRGCDGLRTVCLGLALVPLVLVLISPVFHVINVCYYSWVAFALAAMLAWAVGRIPVAGLRRAVSALLVISLLGSSTICVAYAGRNVDTLERIVRREGITELMVFPGRHAEVVGWWCSELGLQVRTLACPWKREELRCDPDWLLATEYEGVGSACSAPVRAEDYELVTRLTAVGDCYHHSAFVHGGMLRHRRVGR